MRLAAACVQCHQRKGQRMKHSDHGIVRNERAEDQPADRERARTAHRSDADNSASREATRDPKLTDAEKTGPDGGSPSDERR